MPFCDPVLGDSLQRGTGTLLQTVRVETLKVLFHCLRS